MNAHRFAALCTRSAATLRTRAHHGYAGRRDRGDVPGWVLITVMTAGLVTALWAFAGPALVTMFKDALTGVTGK